MLHQAFEFLLAEHCAPTLLSQKCASLVSLSRQSFPDTGFLRDYLASFRAVGIESRIVCRCRNRLLLFLYRPAQLAACLSDCEARKVLRAAGYPETDDLSVLLDALEARFPASCDDFPHEIGIFLGYPPADVEGFIAYKGANCKLSGCWKVYSDTESAEKKFALYNRCRSYLCSALQNGETLAALLRAA